MAIQNSLNLTISGIVEADGAGVFTGLAIPLTPANGGTGSTSFTAGSVIFSNGSILTEDNSNLFWDDTNNRLGIATTTPLDTLHIVGNMDLVHVATENDDHALEIECNAAGFSDVKALDIAYVTGAVGATEDEECMLINIDETLSTGGEVVGLQILTTTEGSAAVIAMKCGPGIDAIRHEVGTFGDMDSALNKAVDVLAALSNGGAGNISMFVADDDTVTIGDAASFGALEIIVDTGASGSGIAPTFEYSTGIGLWATFGPADGTNGFRNTGVIEWDVNDLAGFATGTGTEFLIRITRTRNSLSTTPIIDEVQIAALTEFIWDKNANVNLNSLTLVTDLAVAHGGTGVSSHTAYAVLCGGTTSANPVQSIASVGTSGQVLTSNGASALPSFQAAGAGGGAGWTFISTQTASSDATINFEGLDGTYETYMVIYSYVVPATDNVKLACRIGTGAGPTYQSGVSDYDWYQITGGTASGDATASEMLISQGTGSATNEWGASGVVWLHNPAGTTAYFQITHIGNHVNTAGNIRNQNGSAQYKATTAVTAIQFLETSDNIESGVFTLYGMTNS